MTWEITPLIDDTIDELIALARAVWYAHYPSIISHQQIEYMLEQRYRAELIRAQLHSDAHWWRQLRRDEKMVGFSACERSDKPGQLKLDKLYVHHALHRQGLGSALLADAEQLAREQGCHTIYLQVNRHNHKAVGAYLRNGFVVRECAKFDIGQGFVMDDYVMAKSLDPQP